MNTYPMYGTSPLWRAWIERCRARHVATLRRRPIDLAGLRKQQGLTQTELADS